MWDTSGKACDESNAAASVKSPSQAIQHPGWGLEPSAATPQMFLVKNVFLSTFSPGITLRGF